MKKSLITAGLSLSLILLFSGCKDELEEKYNNRRNRPRLVYRGFFTAILDNNRVRPSYWNVRTFLLAAAGSIQPDGILYQWQHCLPAKRWLHRTILSDFYAHSDNGSG